MHKPLPAKKSIPRMGCCTFAFKNRQDTGPSPKSTVRRESPQAGMSRPSAASKRREGGDEEENGTMDTEAPVSTRKDRLDILSRTKKSEELTMLTAGKNSLAARRPPSFPT